MIAMDRMKREGSLRENLSFMVLMSPHLQGHGRYTFNRIKEERILYETF